MCHDTDTTPPSIKRWARYGSNFALHPSAADTAPGHPSSAGDCNHDVAKLVCRYPHRYPCNWRSNTT